MLSQQLINVLRPDPHLLLMRPSRGDVIKHTLIVRTVVGKLAYDSLPAARK